MKKLIVLCLLALSALGLSGGAMAAGTVLYVSVSPCEDGSDMPADAVAWYTRSGETDLLLPGGTDWNELRVWYSDPEATMEIGGVSYAHGDRLRGVSEGDVLQVRSGSKRLQVTLRRGSAIGALFISTASGSMKKIDRSIAYKEEGALKLLDGDGTVLYDGTLDYIKLRGNTSTGLPKKNYGFKLSRGTDLFGMGKARRWVLLGSYRDKTLLRNQIVYSLADYVGLPYTPQVVQTDVYFNHEYNGTYLLAERIEVQKNRVNITDLEEANESVNDEPLSSYPLVRKNSGKKGGWKAYDLPCDPEDITGGYILEFDNQSSRYGSEKCAFLTKRGKTLLLKDP